MWPFETLVLPRRARAGPRPSSPRWSATALADILSQLTIRYDNLFRNLASRTRLAFTSGPPTARTTRSGTCTCTSYRRCCARPRCSKFMVGYELLASAQRDITAEQAAERSAALPAVHYKKAEAAH
ncbi:MAG: hypothetical protein WKG07_44695 [Hymenobacter sp.]